MILEPELRKCLSMCAKYALKLIKHSSHLHFILTCMLQALVSTIEITIVPTPHCHFRLFPTSNKQSKKILEKINQIEESSSLWQPIQVIATKLEHAPLQSQIDLFCSVNSNQNVEWEFKPSFLIIIIYWQKGFFHDKFFLLETFIYEECTKALGRIIHITNLF